MSSFRDFCASQGRACRPPGATTREVAAPARSTRQLVEAGERVTTIRPAARRAAPPPFDPAELGESDDAALNAALREQRDFEARASRVNCRTSERSRVDPSRAALALPNWKVSILCPTTPRRRKFHGLLVDNWRCQRYAGDVELVVYDTGPGGPSEVLRESGCDYTYAADCAMSLGEKRQFVTDRCGGDVCVLMDDDNVYHPDYVATMVRYLFESGAGLVALKGWLELHAASKKVFRIEGSRGNSRGETMVHLHPRHLEPRYAARATYPKVNVGEEGGFVRWFRCLEIDDDVGLFVHVSHGQNCASQALWGDNAPAAVPPEIADALDRHRAALAHRAVPVVARRRADSDEDEIAEDDD